MIPSTFLTVSPRSRVPTSYSRASRSSSRERGKSSVQHGECVVYGAIDVDSLVQRTPAAAKRPFARKANLADAGLPRGCLDAIDQFADLLLEVVEADQQVGFEDDKEVTIIRVECRSGKYSECLHDKGSPNPL